MIRFSSGPAVGGLTLAGRLEGALRVRVGMSPPGPLNTAATRRHRDPLPLWTNRTPELAEGGRRLVRRARVALRLRLTVQASGGPGRAERRGAYSRSLVAVRDGLFNYQYRRLIRVVVSNINNAKRLPRAGSCRRPALGSNAAGLQTLGLANVTGAESVAYTDASPTSQEAIAKLWAGYDQIANGGQGAADSDEYLTICHPRRLAWFYANAQASQTVEPKVPGRLLACGGLRCNLGAGTKTRSS